MKIIILFLLSQSAYATIERELIPVTGLKVSARRNCETSSNFKSDLWAIRATVDELGDFEVRSTARDGTGLASRNDGEVFIVTAKQNLKFGTLSVKPSEMPCDSYKNAFPTKVELDRGHALYIDVQSTKSYCSDGGWDSFAGARAIELKSQLILLNHDTDEAISLGEARITKYGKDCVNTQTIFRGLRGLITLPMRILFPFH